MTKYIHYDHENNFNFDKISTRTVYETDVVFVCRISPFRTQSSIHISGVEAQIQSLLVFCYRYFGNSCWYFLCTLLVRLINAVHQNDKTCKFLLNCSDTVSDDLIYYQTHFRIGQFLVGIALGYIMYECKGKGRMQKVLHNTERKTMT